MKLWYGKKLTRIGGEYNIEFSTFSYFDFDVSNKESLEDWKKLSSIRQDFKKGRLDKPFKVASGILLISNKNKLLFYIRDPRSYIYRNKIQYPSGMLEYRKQPRYNAIKTFTREIFIWDDDNYYNIKFNNIFDKELQEVTKQKLKKVDNIYGLSYDGGTIYYNDEPLEETYVIAKEVDLPCCPRSVINSYVDGIKGEISRGYIFYDEKLNTIEIVYPYMIDAIDIEKVNIVSFDFMVLPTILIPLDVFIVLNNDFFSMNTRLLRNTIVEHIEEF